MNYINRPAAVEFVTAAAVALADALVSEHGPATAPSPAVNKSLEWGVHIAIDVAAQNADDSAIISALVYFGDASPAAMMALSEDELLEYVTENAGLLAQVALRAGALCAWVR